LVDGRLARNATAPTLLDIEVIDLNGQTLLRQSVEAKMESNSAVKITTLASLSNVTDVHFLCLQLKNGNTLEAKNTYWLAPTLDVMNWDNSTWYHTPVTKYSNFTALANMAKADVDAAFDGNKVTLVNKSKVPAVFVRLNLVDPDGKDVLPVKWSENYMTLWPGEQVAVTVEYQADAARIEVDGRNLDKRIIEEAKR
jgi:exo-1,4-beta-D-glucosaminidase